MARPAYDDLPDEVRAGVRRRAGQRSTLPAVRAFQAAQARVSRRWLQERLSRAG